MSEEEKWRARASRSAELLRSIANDLDSADSASSFGRALMRLNEMAAVGMEIDEEIVERGGPTGPVNA